MTEKNRFKTKIGNKEYTFVGNSSDEHMEAVSQILNTQLKQLKKASDNLDDEDAAILIAFNAISDQLEKQLELDRIEEEKERN